MKKIIFEYVPRAPQFSSIRGDGEKYTIINMQQCGKTFETGKPILPVRTLTVGIPAHGSATVKMIDLQFQEIGKFQILPAPKIKTEETSVSEHKIFKDQKIYSNDSFYPKVHFKIGQPSWFRHQRVVNVDLYPVQFNPVTESLLICKKMIIEIDFNSGKETPQKRTLVTDPVFSDLYREQILNANVSKKWCFSNRSSLGKKATLFTGSWYKLIITEEGIYKLGYNDFAQTGLDSTLLNPGQIQIYYGGGRELPRDIQAAVPDLLEIATYFYDQNSDGRFGINDYILFYGQGTSGWEFKESKKRYSHYINHYTDKNIYWLTIDNGPSKRMITKDGSKKFNENSTIMNTCRQRYFEEHEILNDEKSGIEWMWDRLYGTMFREYHFQAQHVSQQDSVTLRVRLQGITENHHNMSVSLNGHVLDEFDLPFTLSQTITMSGTGAIQEGDNTLKIEKYSSGASPDEVYFDWYEVKYGQFMFAQNGLLEFFSSGKHNVLEYHLQGFDSSDVSIFDTTDPFNVQKIENFSPVANGTISFRDSVAYDQERQYIALEPENFKEITDILPASNPFSNLRLTSNAADYVIITHESLNGHALQLLAQHRSNPKYWPHKGTAKVKIVTTNEIYDEFSWGLFDPTAIRNFLKYAYENWSTAPSYVLLVGDACYDMKNHNGGSPFTFVPTFEDALRATDDWFVCLDGDRTMDMLIGRLPVQSKDELDIVIGKIINYDTTIPYGPWKNSMLFVADDQFANQYNPEDYVFGRDTESLAENPISKSYDVQKLYLQNYTRNQFGKKPQAKKKLINDINNGLLYVNFLGHGNLEVLTHEDIFYSPDDIAYLKNGNRLPLFFFGTCAVGQFDYDRKKSMAEELLLHPDGGCLASIAGTRWNAHQFTFEINRDFYNILFSHSASGESMTFGQALVSAKIRSRYPDHRELLTLFGDPAQRLATPKYTLDFTLSPDSIDLTKNVWLHGKVKKGNKTLSDFNGDMFVKLYDSFLKRNATDYSYLMPGRVLFEDTLEIQNGKTDAHFFLHGDTLAGGKLGRIVAYAWEKRDQFSESTGDASGHLDSLFIIADTLSATTKLDSVPPDVEIEINNTPVSQFSENNIYVDPSFVMDFYIKDEDSGIYASHGSGYEMSVQLDSSQG
ncbi:MAG: type IX secretion system sortase PorU [Calditrichaeota bacterium]|nr:type IX secretion system sortase PorU [Calditrichota bacterium]